jgi:hypothetical protein
MGIYKPEYFFGRHVGISNIQNTFDKSIMINSLQIYGTVQ